MRRAPLLAVLALVVAAPVSTQHGDAAYEPAIESASDAPLHSMATFRPADGLEVSLVAAEPLLANPVAFCCGEDGRIYVVETHRLRAGVIDMRDHAGWVLEDLACRTVEDRVAAIRRHFADELPAWRRERERIRCLFDDDGDGTADRATVFADRFGAYADGIAAGVLVEGDRVWFTAIPSLWELRDLERDGVADVQRELNRGYGVHFSLIGHDLHGLRIGPDRRLYFTIGDRGFHVETPDGRTLAYPDQGAVLRCELDGSGLEVVHAGLRNPQDLAFDAFGNLFTGDNNSDGGDRARWVWVVEGGDSGWQIGYQWLGDRGAWDREKLWLPEHDGQPAWIVPPIDNVAAGPAGLTFCPGTGLPERFDGRFLLCDFRGAAANSGIWSLRVEPSGASFALVDREPLIWQVLATDVDFAPDGGVLLTDWVHGWGKTGRGRVFRVAEPGWREDPRIAEVRSLLAADFATLAVERLLALLAHRDQRVRQKAQFALVDRGAEDVLAAVAAHGDDRFARSCAIHGLGILARRHRASPAPLVPLCADEDVEVRITAVRTLGDVRFAGASGALLARLGDDSLRVRFHAAVALGRLGDPRAVEPLRELLRETGNRDAYLRHAAVTGLCGSADRADVARLCADPDPAVRLGALLVQRRRSDPAIARFLDDEPLLAVEAARAIHDLRIGGALEALAECTARDVLPQNAFTRRAIHARRILGRGEDARALVELAARVDAEAAMRIEALECVADWAEPRQQDRVIGSFLPLRPRSPLVARAAVARHVGSIARGPVRVAIAAVDAVRALGGVDAAAPALGAIVGDESVDGEVRAAALRTLHTPATAAAARTAAAGVGADDPVELRLTALEVPGGIAPEDAVSLLESLVADAAAPVQQRALRTLASLEAPGATDAIGTWLDRLVAGACPPEIRLEILRAAQGRDALAPRVAAFHGELVARSALDPLAPFRLALAGGDARRGERVFRDHPAAQCARCHTVDEAGGDAGPRLDDVGARLDRERLLRSLIEPGAEIAAGFSTIVITRRDGSSVAGVLRSDDGTELSIVGTNGEEIRVLLADVRERSVGAQSAMPPMGGILSLEELRDVVEFLASRR